LRLHTVKEKASDAIYRLYRALPAGIKTRLKQLRGRR